MKKKNVVVLLLLAADALLMFLERNIDGIWLTAALAAAFWFTAITLLNRVSHKVKTSGIINWLKRLTLIALAILEVAALPLAVIFCLQGALLFHPNDNPAVRGRLLSQPGFIEIAFEDGQKSYNGIMRLSGTDEPSPLIIMFAGNGDNSANAMNFLNQNNAKGGFRGFNILVMDYPGYGRSKGTPTGDGIFAEALSAYDYASNLPYVDKSRIIAGGNSIGTGPAVYLAAERDIAGLFIFAPYASGYDLYNNALPIFYGPARLMVKHKLLSERHAPAVSVPVLIVASKDDEIVPYHSSQRLAGCFPNAPDFVTLSGAKHNDVMRHPNALESVKRFLERFLTER